MLKTQKFLFIAALVFFIACNKAKRDDAQYLAFASQAMQDVMPQMMQTVKQEVDKNGYASAVTFCSGFAAEFGKNKNVEWGKLATHDINAKSFRFRRISEKNRNPNNRADAKQSVILAQWLKEGATPTLYRDGTRVTTMHPIKISMPMCLGCHGDAATVDKKAIGEIKRLYPNDLATGYKLGDLRGAFVTEIEL
ncbi:MAG TPA: DUF3365 domain-containing protein [Turneriella sp.]|nr:DUF3365 domain-containing protein [Turneriella sp.]